MKTPCYQLLDAATRITKRLAGASTPAPGETPPSPLERRPPGPVVHAAPVTARSVPEPSPVPGDADPWPGELPFTAWGQHARGTLDLRVFDQAVWWVDIEQRPHRLEEMSDGYIANVIAHLEIHVESYYLGTLRRALYQMYGDLLLSRISTEMVADAFGATPLTELTPREWLDGTPLMRALRRRHASPRRDARHD